MNAIATLGLLSSLAGTAGAQMAEVKEKPAIYTYVASWALPRAKWPEMDKWMAASDKQMEKTLANGTLLAYASESSVLHQADGYTHDNWWTATSQGALLRTLEQLTGNGALASTVLSSVTKHSDTMLVSRYYHWKSGPYKDGYAHNSSYTFKPGAGPDSLEMLSKTVFVPVLEKLLSDGAILEYEIDTEAVHTESPDKFWIFYVAADADGLDKVNAALRESEKSNPMLGSTMDSLIDFTGHRDSISRSSGAFK